MSKKLILIIVAALVVVGGVGAGAYYFLWAPTDAEAAAEPEPPPEPGVVELEPFLTNLSSTKGDRRVRLRVTLAVVPKERAEEILADLLVVAQLRDQILTALGSQSFEKLSTAEGKTEFRGELQKGLSELIQEGEVQQVLFGDFVVQ